MMQGSLAESLRILRAQRGLTLTDAAERAGVTRDTLSDLERGKRHAYMPTLAKIAKGYGVPVEDLLEEPALAGKAKASETGQPEAGEPAEVPWPATVAAVRAKYLPIAAVLNDYCRLYEQLLEREELTDDDAVEFAHTAVDAKEFHTAVIESELVELGVALDGRGRLEGSPLLDLSVLRDAFSRYYRLMRAIREADLLPDGEEKTALAELAARNA
jgi:transcriptional regulator with XRE-family HTH domain